MGSTIAEATLDSETNTDAAMTVRSLTVFELKERLDRGDIYVFDVRPEFERGLAHIPEARSLDDRGQEFLFSLPRESPIAMLCHHGIRSYSAAQQLLLHGFRCVYNVEGGIDAWSSHLDPSVPRY